jgi:hypothetical protein
MQARIKYSKDFIANAIIFLEKELLPLTLSWQQDFVVDLVELKDGSCQVVEFNPYWSSLPCLYGEMKNVGKPFIIETDIYNANKILKRDVGNTMNNFDNWMANKSVFKCS